MNEFFFLTEKTLTCATKKFLKKFTVEGFFFRKQNTDTLKCAKLRVQIGTLKGFFWLKKNSKNGL